METDSIRGQVLLEVLITLTLFVSMTGFIWGHIENHQRRIRVHSPNHEVKDEKKFKNTRTFKESYRHRKDPMDSH
jgi:hypothetical protein